MLSLSILTVPLRPTEATYLMKWNGMFQAVSDRAGEPIVSSRSVDLKDNPCSEVLAGTTVCCVSEELDFVPMDSQTVRFIADCICI